MKLEPQFDSVTAFLQMDGHGLYIWAAFGITLIVLAANLWWPRMMNSRFIRMEKPIAEKAKGSSEQ